MGKYCIRRQEEAELEVMDELQERNEQARCLSDFTEEELELQ